MSIEAEVEGMFAIELARSQALRELVRIAGRPLTEMAWQLGYCSGKGEGLQTALDRARDAWFK